MALIAISAYIYNQSHVLKNMIKGELKFIDKVALIAFFGILGIIGNYTGVNVEPYAMNSIKPMGSIQAGYIGLHDAIANTLKNTYGFQL